jgi:hypothetical protein
LKEQRNTTIRIRIGKAQKEGKILKKRLEKSTLICIGKEEKNLLISKISSIKNSPIVNIDLARDLRK